ncbi:hypothetical protein Hanom_Chr17g01584501 [Helianthus anomalus]
MFRFPSLVVFHRTSPRSIYPSFFWDYFSSIITADEFSIVSICSYLLAIQTICEP